MKGRTPPPPQESNVTWDHNGQPVRIKKLTLDPRHRSLTKQVDRANYRGMMIKGSRRAR